MSKTRSIEHHPNPHSHHEHPDSELRPKAISRLRITFLIGFCLFIGEFIGSQYSHSLALLADSFHVLADLGAVAMTLLASSLAERPQSSKRSYGYYRLEVLAALFNGFILMALSFFVLKAAYNRFHSPHEIVAGLMLWVAIFGLIVNIWMLFILKPAHDHNLNLRSAYLHILGDTISSLAVILSALIIFFTGYTWLDALAGVFVALIIISMALRLIWDSIHILLEGTPKHMNSLEIEDVLRKTFPQIVNIHDFHIWEITSHLFAMTAHIEARVKSLEDSRRLIDGMNAFIKEKYGIGHTTFQIESTSEQTLHSTPPFLFF